MKLWPVAPFFHSLLVWKNQNQTKSECKKGATGQSFIRKEITCYRIGTLISSHIWIMELFNWNDFHPILQLILTKWLLYWFFLLFVIILVKNKNSRSVLSELVFGSIDHEMKFFEPSMSSESLELLLLIPLRIVLKPSLR